MPSSDRIDKLLSVYRDGLLEDTIPFWMKNGMDREHGGIISSLNRDGSILDTDKAVWAQGRSAWMLGELYNSPLCEKHAERETWLAEAIQIGEFIQRCCFDATDGRMWFHLTRDGKPIRKRRYAFSECFAAIAFGELFKATRESTYEVLANKCFEQFTSHNTNPASAEPKFAPTRPTRSIGFPMITIETASQLRDSIGLESADHWIKSSIETIETFFLKPDIECVMEVVGPNGEMLDHFDGRTLNPGHAIEGAWFIMREGKLQNRPEWVELGLQMLEWMWSRGWDSEFGGLMYFVGVDGQPVQVEEIVDGPPMTNPMGKPLFAAVTVDVDLPKEATVHDFALPQE